MIYFPPLRRLLLPALLALAFILYYRSSVHVNTGFSSYIVQPPELSAPGTRIPVEETEAQVILNRNTSENHLSPDRHFYYEFNSPDQKSIDDGTSHMPPYFHPPTHPALQQLFQCPLEPNPTTNHVRLSKTYLRNITVVYHNDTPNENLKYLNPAIISLPFWSKNQYLVVMRVQTDGSYQNNIFCEANICYTNPADAKEGQQPCTDEDNALLGGAPGLRCAMPPTSLNVPPTPAAYCGLQMGIMMDIPGFHDPRVFWTGKGEPLMMVNTQSRYACFGLWVMDLRKLHKPLQNLLASNPFAPSLGPLMSYPSLTEITRNPPSTRGQVEKNWMFFSSRQNNFIHYDMGPDNRAFAKLLGGGLTTVNLTDEYELPCIASYPGMKAVGSWHQATNSLRLVLCNRNDKDCEQNDENTVFFAIIHHKIRGLMGLPARYERYFMVWSAVPPFSMLGISKHPILMANETANGFSAEENWQDDPEHQAMVDAGGEGKGEWARFTYTVSMAYAWGRRLDESQDKNTGYLDDEVIIGVGVDDEDCTYAISTPRDFLQCLRACPGRSSTPVEVATHWSLRVGEKSSGKEEAAKPDVMLAGDLARGDLDEEAAEAIAVEPTEVTTLETSILPSLANNAAAATAAATTSSTDAADDATSISSNTSTLSATVATSSSVSATSVTSATTTNEAEGGAPTAIPVGAPQPTTSETVNMVPADADNVDLDATAPSGDAPPPLVGSEAANKAAAADAADAADLARRE